VWVNCESRSNVEAVVPQNDSPVPHPSSIPFVYVYFFLSAQLSSIQVFPLWTFQDYLIRKQSWGEELQGLYHAGASWAVLENISMEMFRGSAWT
jgi:hypothetical protein